MDVFYTDLDNTIIYSYKRDIGRDKMCVEIYEEREISFITRRTADLLSELSGHVLIIPATTRTIEQYRRIKLPVSTPPYALVCNGGVLLVEGKECEEWYRDSIELAEDCQSDLRKAEKMLCNDPDVDFEVRNIKDLFLFTKSARPQETVKRLQSGLDGGGTDVFQNGKKVYVVPKQMNKGLAVRRLQEKLRADGVIPADSRVIAAGDSEFDIPMLAAADIAVAPAALARSAELPAEAVVMGGDGIFSDFLLDHVRNKAKVNKVHHAGMRSL